MPARGLETLKGSWTVQTLSKCPANFNGATDHHSLPLWQATRETELRRLPIGARKLATRYGLDGSTARLIATLAGIGAQ